MIKTTELALHFTILVTTKNIELVKSLAASTMIEEDPEDIEEGDEIPVEFCLEGNFTEFALTMAMLFNSSVKGKPFIRIIRQNVQKKKENKVLNIPKEWGISE